VIYRNLGKTGMSVSALGLGTVKLGRNERLRFGTFDIPSDRRATALLACAQSLGINMLDTAPSYGTIEARLQSLLPGRREDWIISTKVGETFHRGTSVYDFSAHAVRTSVMRSIERLGYLDIVLVHSNGETTAMGALAELHELKAQGLVRAIGMSNKGPDEGLTALSECDVVMPSLNCAYRDEIELIATAQRLGCGVLVKKPLNSGQTSSGESLRFALNQPGVSSVIVGTINARHLERNVEAITPT
jgi:aryl-alcohol dehydrogenase-like predicted oxidoreductase